jgi:hypothetical protein
VNDGDGERPATGSLLNLVGRALWPIATLAMFFMVYPEVRGILQALPEVFGRASKVTVAGVELDISPTLARKLTKTEQDAIPKLSRAAIILLLNSKPGIIGKVDYYAGSEHGEGIEAYNVLASTGLMAKTDLDPSKCEDDFKKQAGDKARCFEVEVTDAGGRFREFLSDVIAEKLNLTE